MNYRYLSATPRMSMQAIFQYCIVDLYYIFLGHRGCKMELRPCLNSAAHSFAVENDEDSFYNELNSSLIPVKVQPIITNYFTYPLISILACNTSTLDYYNQTIGKTWVKRQNYELPLLPLIAPVSGRSLSQRRVHLPHRRWKDCSNPCIMIQKEIFIGYI